MRISVDSSSFAKRYIQEVGSDEIDDLLQGASELALCVILIPEIISGLNRRLREQALTIRDYRQAKKQLMNDIHDATVLQITPAVVSHSVKLLEHNALRAMDALHVASALEWHADLFITSDQRQMEAATNTGIRTIYVGQPLED